jgi:hypothetical protein
MTTPPDVLRALESLEANQRNLQSSLRRQHRLVAITFAVCGVLGLLLAFSFTRSSFTTNRDEPRVAAESSDRPASLAAARPDGDSDGDGDAVDPRAPSSPSEPDSTVASVEAAGPAASADSSGASMAAGLNAQIAALQAQIDEGKRASQAQMQEIERLRTEVKRKDEALTEGLRRFEERVRAERESHDAIKSEVDGLPRNPLVEAINARLLEQSVLEYRLLEYGGVAEHELRDSRWALCNGRGTAIGVAFAARCQISADTAAQAMVIRLLDGWMTRGADKEPLIEQRWVVPTTSFEAWSKSPLDTLVAVAPAPRAPPLPSPPSLEKIREQLAILLEKYGYSLRQLESVDGTELKRIIVDEGAMGTTPKRTITAEQCRIQVVEPGGYVEVVFENGSITRRGREMRFYGNRYRLALPHSVPAEWQQALPGMISKRDSSRA